MTKKELYDEVSHLYYNENNIYKCAYVSDLYLEYFGHLDEYETKKILFFNGFSYFEINREKAVYQLEKLYKDEHCPKEDFQFIEQNLNILYKKNNELIPKIIHLIYFKEHEFTQTHYRCILSLLSNMSNYKIKIYNDDEPENNTYWENLKSTNIIEIIKYKRPIEYDDFELKNIEQSVDITCMTILYEEGGIYLDFDILVVKNFEYLFRNNKDLYISSENEHKIYSNIIGVKPKHAFINLCLEMFKINLRQDNDTCNIYSIYTKLLDQNRHYKIKYKIEILDRVYFYPFHLNEHDIFKNNKVFKLHHKTYGIKMWYKVLHSSIDLFNSFPNIEYQLNLKNEYYTYFNEINFEFNNKRVCFIHCCNNQINTGLKKLNYLLEYIHHYIINDLDKIIIVNIGCELKQEHIKYFEKCEIIQYSNKINLFEIPTINFIRIFSEFNSNIQILYLHTKGIGYKENSYIYNCVFDWLNLMLYFLIRQKGYIQLNNNDCCGINYHEKPYSHFSGNFWWSNSNYIKNLPIIYSNKKHSVEWWILSNNGVKYKELYKSGINHYQQPYHQENYIKEE